MIIKLETKPNTENRKRELNKFKGYLKEYYKNNKDPFNCKYQCEDSTEDCHIKCIEEYINKQINKIDKEGILYL